MDTITAATIAVLAFTIPLHPSPDPGYPPTEQIQTTTPWRPNFDPIAPGYMGPPILFPPLIVWSIG